MTIPEEMMAVIQETARKAAREGAKEVIARSIRTKRVTMTARKKKLRWNCLI